MKPMTVLFENVFSHLSCQTRTKYSEEELALYFSNIPKGFQSFKKKITSVKSSLWQPHIKYF